MRRQIKHAVCHFHFGSPANIAVERNRLRPPVEGGLSIVKAQIILVATLMSAACSDMRAPIAPTVPSLPSTTAVPVPSPVNGANWAADAIVVSATGGFTCGWGTSPGETRSGVLWRIITQEQDTITLDEDMPNWPTDDIPFRGRLTGTHFDAEDVEVGGGVCAFRGGELTGVFSDDGLTFQATETLHWGSTEHFSTVQRRWMGRRLPSAVTNLK